MNLKSIVYEVLELARQTPSAKKSKNPFNEERVRAARTRLVEETTEFEQAMKKKDYVGALTEVADMTYYILVMHYDDVDKALEIVARDMKTPVERVLSAMGRKLRTSHTEFALNLARLKYETRLKYGKSDKRERNVLESYVNYATNN